MCFAPQWRTLLRHHNFQKGSEHGVYDAFWFGNVLRATTACTFSSYQLPKVVRTWCVCTFWRHNGAHFFRHHNFQKWSDVGVFCTFWLRNVLRATTVCNFSSLIWPAGSTLAALASLLFDPPVPQNIGKTLCFATFLPFRAPRSSFVWDFLFLIFVLLLFSSLTFPIPAFHLSILSGVWLLNFLGHMQLYHARVKLHYTTRHYTTLHNATLHYTTIHYTYTTTTLQRKLPLQPQLPLQLQLHCSNNNNSNSNSNINNNNKQQQHQQQQEQQQQQQQQQQQET